MGCQYDLFEYCPKKYEFSFYGWEEELIFTIGHGLFAISSRAKSPTLTTSKLPLVFFSCVLAID
jgi:hypothetical protein